MTIVYPFGMLYIPSLFGLRYFSVLKKFILIVSIPSTEIYIGLSKVMMKLMPSSSYLPTSHLNLFLSGYRSFAGTNSNLTDSESLRNFSSSFSYFVEETTTF